MVHVFRAVLVLYALACLAVVLWPTPIDRPVASDLNAVIAFLQRHGIPALTYSRVEVAANVGMFIPLGALGVLSFPRTRWWVVALACLVLSASVELVQFVFIEHRFASVTDVASNAVGGLIGAVLGLIIRRSVRGRAAQRTRF